MTEGNRHMDIRNQERRRVGCALFAGIVIFCACFAVYFLFQIKFVQRNYLYPFPYQEEVEEYAVRYHVDRNLAAAVIKNESKFRATAQSHRGAVGLMQIMPETGEWIAGQIEDDPFTIERLHDPETNIRYGIWYIASLEQEFEGNDVLVLAAYNAGRGTVRSWMDKYRWGEKFSDVGAIPYVETRSYVRKVLMDREKYRKLYQKNRENASEE